MGPPGSRDVSQTHGLFVDDLKVHQGSHEILRDANKVIVLQATIQEHAMEHRNLQKSFSNIVRWLGEED